MGQAISSMQAGVQCDVARQDAAARVHYEDARAKLAMLHEACKELEEKAEELAPQALGAPPSSECVAPGPDDALPPHGSAAARAIGMAATTTAGTVGGIEVEDKQTSALAESIVSKILWRDIAGAYEAKQVLYEICTLPTLCGPGVLVGCRRVAKTVLLHGPAGTGKTSLAQATANETRRTFFSVRPSNTVSKWAGDSEKYIRSVFAAARACREESGAIVFFDEIDCLAASRDKGDDASAKRLLGEVLIQMSALTSEDLVLVIAATNRIEDLDEALVRRFEARIYVGLPAREERGAYIRAQLDGIGHALDDEDFERILNRTHMWNCCDLLSLVREATMYPLREALAGTAGQTMITTASLRAVEAKDFELALCSVVPSASYVGASGGDSEDGSASGPAASVRGQ